MEASPTELCIEKTIELDAPPERVWKAITDPLEVSQWFPDRAEWNASVGSRGTLEWDGHGSFEVEIVEVEPLNRFAWRWPGGEDRPLQEYSTLVEWTLESRQDGGTTLHLRESGFDNQKKYRENKDGWKKELNELLAYLS